MNLNLSRSSSYFLIIILLIFHRISNASGSSKKDVDSKYAKCMSNNTSTCGTADIKIWYPFWGNGHPLYCGHPGFELSCDASNNNLKINIDSETYNVKGINYNRSTLQLVRREFSQDLCPEPKDLHNTTLDLTLFNYTSGVKNATLFYDCPSARIDTNAPFSFRCQDYPNPLSYFVITPDWEHELERICGVKVYVPVYREAIQDLIGNSTGVSGVLEKGFEVKWVTDQGECQKCYNSGGCCGYDMAINKSTCFCENGASYPNICPLTGPRKVLNTEEKVGIGIGAAAGGLLIIIMLIYVLRPSKEYHSSSTLPSEKFASGQPSTTNVEEKTTYFGAHLFSYRKLERATNNFEPSKELGKGGFGTVYHGKLQDGRDVAIKRLYEKHSKQVEQFMNELEILARLDHKNLVKLYGCTSRKSRQLLLVYEYVPNGTVSDHLHGKRAKPGSLPWPIRLRIAVETASALVYLHASDIIHRDVKTKNILLDANYSVKVADFGLSRLFPLDATHVSTTPQGSPGYVDPEYHQSYQLTDKSDVYSLGVVLAELLSAKPAVDRSRSKVEINLSNMAINKIQNKALSEFVDPSLGFEKNSKVREEVEAVAELTFRCLQATRETRPAMDEVLGCLNKLQREDSKGELPDISKDVMVVSGSDDENDQISHDRQSALQSGPNSQISVVVNVSSDAV